MIKSKKVGFAVTLVLLFALAVSMLFVPTVKAQVSSPKLGGEEIIFENFETASITTAEGKKKVTENIYTDAKVNMEIVTEASGNKALKFMLLEDDVSGDEKSLVIKKTGLTPMSNYKVSFFAKRATNIWVAAELRSGLHSNDYAEKRVFSTAGNDAFGENVEDRGVLITQIMPTDPGGNLLLSITPEKIFPHDINLGFVFDEFRITPYNPIPAGGGANILSNAGFKAFWTGEWGFNDGNDATNDWSGTVGSGFNSGGDRTALSDEFNAYLGTADLAPVDLAQTVTLKANTEYNFSIWAKRHGQGFTTADTLSFSLNAEDYESKVSFSSDNIGQDAYEQYVNLGGVLKTADATQYTYKISHLAAQPMTWRGFQIDEAYLYEASSVPALSLAAATKSANVTEVNDFYSAVAGDKVLQADISANDATICYELSTEANSFYNAYIDAQKIHGLIAGNNVVKPMDISFTIETAADDSGSVLATISDYSEIGKAVQQVKLTFNSAANTAVYLKITASVKASQEAFILNNLKVNFKNFAYEKIALTSIEAANDFDINGNSTRTLTVIAKFGEHTFIDVTADATVASSAPSIVSVSGNVLTTTTNLGSADITVTYGDKTDIFTVNVLDYVTAIDSGEDRNIERRHTDNLVVTATYAVAAPEEVTANAEVTIEDLAVVSYANGTFSTLKVGKTLVTVKFGGATDTFTLTVVFTGVVEPESITVNENTTLSKDKKLAVIVNVHYNNDVSEVVTSGVTIVSDSTHVTVGGLELTAISVGSAVITVNYMTFSETFTVTVPKEVVSISMGDDITLRKGESVSVTVIATYSDDTTGEVNAALASSTQAVVANGKVLTANKVGTSVITAASSGKTTTITVTVPKEISGVKAIGDMALAIGNDSTLKIKAVYNDNTEADAVGAIVTSSDSTIVAIDGYKISALKTGEATITVTYTGKTTTFKVAVTNPVVEITITGELKVNIDNQFALTVTAKYADGNTKAVTDYTIKADNDNVTIDGTSIKAAKAGKTGLIISFGGQLAEIEVEVVAVAAKKGCSSTASLPIALAIIPLAAVAFLTKRKMA